MARAIFRIQTIQIIREHSPDSVPRLARTSHWRVQGSENFLEIARSSSG